MPWAPLLIVISGLCCAKSLCTMQGAATSVYAATAPELAGKAGAYLVDCQIAEPSVQARDADLARKLWAETERQLQDPSARL